MTAAQRLTAVDVLRPEAGDVVEVVDGSALVFVELPDGRRVPVTRLAAGEVVVSPSAVDGARFLVTGVEGARVVVARVTPGDPRLADWVRRASSIVANGRLPQRVAPLISGPASRGLRLGPSDDSGLTWIRVAGGAVQFCDDDAIRVQDSDGPLPIPSGAWVAVSEACRVHVVDEQPEWWAPALDWLGGCVTRVSVARHQAAMVERRRRIESAAAQSSADLEQTVTLVTSALGGVPKAPIEAELSDETRVVVDAARFAGLVIDVDALSTGMLRIQGGERPEQVVAALGCARTRRVTLAGTWWTREGTAMLVDMNGPDGLVRRAAVWQGHWWIVDSASGKRIRVDARLATQIRENALEFVPLLRPGPSNWRDLRRLAIRRSGREAVVVLLITAMLAALAFATPFLLGQLADLFAAQSPVGAYVALFGALVMVAVVSASWGAVRELALIRVRTQATSTAASAIWDRVMRLPAAWHASRTLGQRTVMTGAVNSASAALPDTTVARLLDVTAVLGSLAAVATTSLAMLGALATVLGLQILISFAMIRMASRCADERLAYSAGATSRLMELLQSVSALRVAGAEARALLEWARLQAPFARVDQRLRRIGMAQGVILTVWPLLALVVVVAVAAVTRADFGDFVTAQVAAAAACAAVAAMALAGNSAVVARQTLRQASGILQATPEASRDGADPGMIGGAVAVRDVTFRYGPRLPVALDRLSLTIDSGEHVALVGPSGSGKSTLARVLLGLDDPESGSIAFDGRDFAALDRAAVRRQIGAVLQSSRLLPCSIRDNVSMGRDLSSEQVWEALRLAALAGDVKAMAMSLDTLVTDGESTVSGGQRQRILLARAIAGTPRILVLDEATSSVDNATQARLVEAVRHLRMTRIVIAHRLSTIRHADRIVVLDAGRVAQQGTYDELVAAPGIFRDLVERQHL